MQEKQIVEKLREACGGPMSDAEIGFLRDVQGFIDFAIRNGLSFQAAMTYLSNDWNELAKYGFDFETVTIKGFLPRVSGFSDTRADAVGEPD